MSNSSPSGTITFISEDLAVTISAPIESLLRNIWQPSVLSTRMRGALPKDWTWTPWQLTISQPATRLSNTTPVFLQESRITLLQEKKRKIPCGRP